MLLADDVVQGPGPEACRQGRPGRQPLGRRAGEEVVVGHARAAHSFRGMGCSPSSASTPGATGFGAPVIGSDPDWVFGKAITSRMLSSPAKMATSRSMPTANPACGGAP